MKNKFKFLLASGVIALTTLAACEKNDDDHDHEPDTTKPVVSLTSPLNLAVYNFGDTVWIKGTMQDNSLHEAVISIMNDTTNAVLFAFQPIVHEKTSYAIDTFYKAAVNTKTKATLTVQAMDHADNIGSASVRIELNP